MLLLSIGSGRGCAFPILARLGSQLGSLVVCQNKNVSLCRSMSVGLEALVAAVGTDKHVGVHEYVVGVVCLDLSCHSRRLENQMRELLLLFGGEQVEVARHPHAYLCIHEFLVFQSRLFEEQLQHGLALLFHLFLFLAHNAVILWITGANIRNFMKLSCTRPNLFEYIKAQRAVRGSCLRTN